MDDDMRKTCQGGEINCFYCYLLGFNAGCGLIYSLFSKIRKEIKS